MCFVHFLSLSVSLQKFYKEKYNQEKGKSSYTNMKTLPEVEHAMEVNKKQSDVKTHNTTQHNVMRLETT